MIFYLTLALALTARLPLAPKFAVVGAVLLSLLIGTSRVMLGVHWPSDVIGGWAFGMLWVLLTLKPAERLLRREFRNGTELGYSLSGAIGGGVPMSSRPFTLDRCADLFR